MSFGTIPVSIISYYGSKPWLELLIYYSAQQASIKVSFSSNYWIIYEKYCINTLLSF